MKLFISFVVLMVFALPVVIEGLDCLQCKLNYDPKTAPQDSHEEGPRMPCAYGSIKPTGCAPNHKCGIKIIPHVDSHGSYERVATLVRICSYENNLCPDSEQGIIDLYRKERKQECYCHGDACNNFPFYESFNLIGRYYCSEPTDHKQGNDDVPTCVPRPVTTTTPKPTSNAERVNGLPFIALLSPCIALYYKL